MAYLADNRATFPDGFPRNFLLRGFPFGAERVPLIAAQQGIHKPRILALPLSILTTPAKLGVPRPYEDEFDYDDCLLYRYRGTDPNHRDNVGLRRVMEASLPIIYVLSTWS